MAGETDTPLDEAEIEAGRLLFARECQFVAGAATADALPTGGLLEVAFAGRSNVGKSSLVNALTGRNALARTSRTPGRTQQINFFQLHDTLILVDLPGYGFARASKAKIGAWTELMHDYLKGRAALRRLCLLIDSRHGLKESDRELMEELDVAAVVYQVVLTKCDKLTAGALRDMTQTVTDELARHPAAHPDIIATSSQSRTGIAQLRAALAALASPEQTR
ncbi:MAG: ribosome biogenesis GTP-binding protein YihA/YsxC [Alphaproteobacteria bacterium]